MDTIPVIKIEMAGTVTSFRYPYFTQGVHPTFEMPPPSTIYGHICSAVGNWLADNQLMQLQFGYRFIHSGKFIDYKEHLHFSDPIQPFPFDRELLFNPRLTLYLTDLSLFEAFKRPYYPVALGRSQDLMSYLSIQKTELQRVESGYFDNTLLPLEMATRLDATLTAVTMARYIDPRRRPLWSSYSLLQGIALYPPVRRSSRFSEEEGLIFEGDNFVLWQDPDSPSHPKYPELKRLVWLHRFVEEINHVA